MNEAHPTLAENCEHSLASQKDGRVKEHGLVFGGRSFTELRPQPVQLLLQLPLSVA